MTSNRSKKKLPRTKPPIAAFREKAPLLGKSRDGLEMRQERLNSIQTKCSAMLLQKVELEGQLSALEAGLKDGRSQDVMLAMLVEFMRKADSSEAGRPDQLFPLLMEERKLIQVHGANHDAVKEIRTRIEVASAFACLAADRLAR